MELLGDKLLLRLAAKQSLNNCLLIKLEKNNNTKRYLLPFSCISLINSQLTILSENQRQSLCTSVLKFVAKPEKLCNPTRLVSKFVFELYQKDREKIYNQFNPIILAGSSPSVNFVIEKDIVSLLMNFTSAIFKKSSQDYRNKIRVYLLASISFFQQELLPIIKNIDMNDIQNRQKLAMDHVNFSSSIYLRWESPPPFNLKSDLFDYHLTTAMNFDTY